MTEHFDERAPTDPDRLLTPREQTTLVRERNTVAATTAMLSEAGRGDRDRLLIASAIALLAALPVVVEKVTLGPIELSALPLTVLRWGVLLALVYFSLSFATQAIMDLLKWSANLTLALVDMKPRLNLHQAVLDQRSIDASASLNRFRQRMSEFRQRIEPLERELFQLLAASRDPARVAALETEIAALHDRLTAENAADDVSHGPSEDFTAVMGIGKRISRLRAIMWTNVIVNVTMPLVIAAISAGPVIWSLWTAG